MAAKETKQVEMVGRATRLRYDRAKGAWIGSFYPDELDRKIHSLPPGVRIEVVGPLKGADKYGRILIHGRLTRFTPANAAVWWSLDAEGFAPQERMSEISLVESLALHPGIPYITPTSAREIASTITEKELLDTLEGKGDHLQKVSGFGEKRTESIRSSWQATNNAIKGNWDVYGTLRRAGLGHKRTMDVMDAAEERMDWFREKLKSSPYSLSFTEISRGSGVRLPFRVADTLGLQRGMPPDSFERICTGITYTCSSLVIGGTIGVLTRNVVREAVKLLGVDAKLVQETWGYLREHGYVLERVVRGKSYTILAEHDRLEADVARLLIDRQRVIDKPKADQERVLKGIHDAEVLFGVTLTDLQRDAILQAFQHPVSILTGGPGTGKTTTMRVLAKVAESLGLEISGCAPYGIAARRLEEAAGIRSATVHRMLATEGGLTESLDLLIVDETSTMDLYLVRRLLIRLRESPKAHVVFLGDPEQLPSIQAGQLLRDMLDSKVLPVVSLDQVFRQGTESAIVQAYQKLRVGEIPESGGDDLEIIQVDDPSTIPDLVVDLVKRLAREGVNVTRDLCVLSPQRTLVSGTVALNGAVREALLGLPGDAPLSSGDRVIQRVNDYDRGVVNGSIGVVVGRQGDSVAVEFDEKVLTYDEENLDNIELAFSMTTHKSIGSEVDYAIIVATDNHSFMLERPLIVTALTRAKKKAFLLHGPKLSTFVKKIRQRVTFLDDHLRRARKTVIEGIGK